MEKHRKSKEIKKQKNWIFFWLHNILNYKIPYQKKSKTTIQT